MPMDKSVKLLEQAFSECTENQFKEVLEQYQELSGPDEKIPDNPKELAKEMISYMEKEYWPKNIEEAREFVFTHILIYGFGG